LQCAEYNQTSGDFELRNLLKDVKWPFITKNLTIKL
jgi:hypothetical protein